MGRDIAASHIAVVVVLAVKRADDVAPHSVLSPFMHGGWKRRVAVPSPPPHANEGVTIYPLSNGYTNVLQDWTKNIFPCNLAMLATTKIIGGYRGSENCFAEMQNKSLNDRVQDRAEGGIAIGNKEGNGIEARKNQGMHKIDKSVCSGANGRKRPFCRNAKAEESGWFKNRIEP